MNTGIKHPIICHLPLFSLHTNTNPANPTSAVIPNSNQPNCSAASIRFIAPGPEQAHAFHVHKMINARTNNPTKKRDFIGQPFYYKNYVLPN